MTPLERPVSAERKCSCISSSVVSCMILPSGCTVLLQVNGREKASEMVPKSALIELSDFAAIERAAARPELANWKKRAETFGVSSFESSRVSRSDDHDVTVHFQVPQISSGNRARRSEES